MTLNSQEGVDNLKAYL